MSTRHMSSHDRLRSVDLMSSVGLRTSNEVTWGLGSEQDPGVGDLGPWGRGKVGNPGTSYAPGPGVGGRVGTGSVTPRLQETLPCVPDPPRESGSRPLLTEVFLVANMGESDGSGHRQEGSSWKSQVLRGTGLTGVSSTPGNGPYRCKLWRVVARGKVHIGPPFYHELYSYGVSFWTKELYPGPAGPGLEGPVLPCKVSG